MLTTVVEEYEKKKLYKELQCDYNSNRGHLTKFSTNSVHKNRGG